MLPCACSAPAARNNAAIDQPPDPVQAAMRHLLAARGGGKTVCPSEVARALAGTEGDWRARMDDVHAAVDTMVARRAIALSWKGTALPRRDGPYRIGNPE